MARPKKLPDTPELGDRSTQQARRLWGALAETPGTQEGTQDVNHRPKLLTIYKRPPLNKQQRAAESQKRQKATENRTGWFK